MLIGSVRDSRRIQAVFQEYRPEVVFHAAAHKHVPLMEGSPNEAIKNNVLGTYKTAYRGPEVRGAAVRAHQHGQGSEPHQHHGRQQAAVRDGGAGHGSGQLHRRVRPAAGAGAGRGIPQRHAGRHTVRSGAVRQRAGQQRLGDPAVQEADRDRRAGDGDASRHHPVLYDHSRRR